jgi:hypothetical protein
MTHLHITNGDSTVELLDAAKISGEKLPWRDVLHEGPVPITDSLAQLSAMRATFITERGWGEIGQIKQDFEQRDAIFNQTTEYETIYLWFEHDLYDQLQLIQILSEWQAHGLTIDNLLLINPNKHLGYHTPEEVPALFASAKPVKNEQIDIAVIAWKAFRQSTPLDWFELLKHDLSALPFLRSAVLRMLQELPNNKTGLSKSEHLALSIIREGIDQKGPLFQTYCVREDDTFMGDWSFFHMLEELVTVEPNLLIYENKRYKLTHFGDQVFTGKQNRMHSCAPVRSFGGYKQKSPPFYYWEEELQRVTQE